MNIFKPYLNTSSITYNYNPYKKYGLNRDLTIDKTSKYGLNKDYSINDKPYLMNNLEDINLNLNYKNKIKNNRIKEKKIKEDDPNKKYNNNININAIKSILRQTPLIDSINNYLKIKRETPDYSNFINAKNEALKKIDIYKNNPVYISNYMKYEPYDYSNEVNRINSITSNAIDTLSSQSRGNFNLLSANINNILNRNNISTGQAYNNAWQQNQNLKNQISQFNRETDKINADANNLSENNYINNLNNANLQNKQNAINALNTYANNIYGINNNYENKLNNAREQMVDNINSTGLNAYNNNKINSNKVYDYYYDDFGIQHHYNSDNNNYNNNDNISEDVFRKIFSNSNTEQKNQLLALINKYGFNKGRQIWTNSYDFTDAFTDNK